VNRKPTGSNLLAAQNRRELLFKANQPSAANSNQKLSDELSTGINSPTASEPKTEPPENSAAKSDRKISGDALLPNEKS
jgi:hypothetical protein